MHSTEHAAMSTKHTIYLSIALIFLSILHVFDGQVLVNTSAYLHDFWFVTDTYWRARAGNIVHVDVHTPIGQAFFWPYRVADLFLESGTGAMLLAGVIVGLVSAGLTRYFAGNKPQFLVWGSIALFAFLTAITPRMLGHLIPLEFNHLAPYNRWGWSLLAPLALYSFVPNNSQNTTCRSTLYGVVCGALLLLKITYGLVGFGFLFIAVLFKNRSFSQLLWALLGCAMMISIVALANGNIAQYMNDLAFALRVNVTSIVSSVRLRIDIAKAGIVYSAVVLIMLAATTILLLLTRKTKKMRIILIAFKSLIFCAVVIVATLAISTQNFPKRESTFFFVAIVLAYAWCQYLLHRYSAQASDIMRFALLCFLLVGTLVSTGRDFSGVVAHRYLASVRNTNSIELFTGTPLEGLRVSESVNVFALGDKIPIGDECKKIYGTSGAQLKRVLTALPLLQANSDENAIIQPLDAFNPFPALTNTLPPVGAMHWMHPGRTLSEDHHPAAADIFKSVTVVLRSNECGHRISEALWKYYQPYLQKNYSLTAQNNEWQLYIKNQID